MDGYNKYMNIREKYLNFTPEEKLRWHLANDCTCHVIEFWWNPVEHFGNCPLQNADNEQWIFFEGVEEGFVFPS